MEKRRLLILLALALAARAGAFLLAARGGILIGEGRVYSNLAENLLEGRGYVLSADMLSPPEPARGAASVIQERTFEFYRRVDGFYGVLRPERPTLFIPPGYPVLMAAGYAILGAGNLLAIRGLQLLAGLVTVILGFALARRHLRNPEAWLVCLFIALDPFEIYFEAVPATQAAFGLFTTAALVLSTRALDGGRALQAALASSVWGLAYLIRPAAMPMMCVFLLCILLVRGRPVSARLAAIGTGILSFVIVLSPWILHAHSVSGQWRITPTQGGVNLWESNGRTSPLTSRARSRGRSRCTAPSGTNSKARSASPGWRSSPSSGTSRSGSATAYSTGERRSSWRPIPRSCPALRC